MPALRKILPLSVVNNGDVAAHDAPSSADVEHEVHAEFQAILDFAKGGVEGETFMAFEKSLFSKMQALGRLIVVLFLTVRAERERAEAPSTIRKQERRFERRPPQPRNLNTIFGVVRYFRTYYRGAEGHGFHPLDVALGLATDRISLYVLSLGARLATLMSFAQAHTTLGWFVGTAPSTEVIEQTVLGLGRRTGEWFEHAPAPKGDGDVLLILIDSKGAPTATESELEHRRGPRRLNPYPDSDRHRGRDRREIYGGNPRRKKGDKSKNARMATLAVMYTLRRASDGSGRLLGPINKQVYGSFASKRHAFAIARREADKRGFTTGVGKLVQVVTDGDEDLAGYTKQFFPEAIHTIDVIHVLEYVWTAGECLFREGSDELTAWMEEQKTRLYGGGERELVAELTHRLAGIPLTGPGNKGRRTRLAKSIGYIEKRLDQMNYKGLLERDLEVGSGAAEGAVKNIIGARFDFGGSRWIRERAEALLQLRCIEKNGQWDAFVTWVHDDHRQRSQATGERIRVQQKQPFPLPTLGVAA